MTIYQFKKMHETKNPDSYYFSPDTLKFYGERLSEMRVYKKTTHITDDYGREHECYVISSYQRNAPKGVNPRKLHYFDVDTLDRVLSKNE